VGLSGGLDSVVLLHLLRQLAQRFFWQLSVLHVHHGISPHADAWADFCARLCAADKLPFFLEHVDIQPLREQGIEAAARQLRYAAYAKYPRDFLALAHHADDQVETLLLQLLRGSGVRGTAAMPMLVQRDTQWLRPLLNCTRAEIIAYAQAHHLQWIEDESNADDSYPRNFLRHNIMPLVAAKFPAYRHTLARSAQHFAEAAELLDELAQLDATSAIHDEKLHVAALKKLSEARAKNLLRHFLQTRGAPMPQTVQLADMLQQLTQARDDAQVCVAFSDWQVRRYQGEVYAMPALPDFDATQCIAWTNAVSVPWHALNMRVDFVPTTTAGISLAKLRAAPVTLRFRQGGETLRPHANAAKRTLKNWLQEQHIPPWLRDRVPLLFCGEDLVCTPGAIAADFQAWAGEAGVEMRLNPRS
jgi:tRNA(Ile)-lysidine synthase